MLLLQIASKIVTIAYSKHANTQQKKFMRQDFYGEMFKLSRNDSVQCLEDAFKTSETMKDAIIASTRTNVQKVLSKYVKCFLCPVNYSIGYLCEIYIAIDIPVCI